MPDTTLESPIIDPQRSSCATLTYRVDFIDNWERTGSRPFCATLTDHVAGCSIVGFGDDAYQAVADMLTKAADFIRNAQVNDRVVD